MTNNLDAAERPSPPAPLPITGEGSQRQTRRASGQSTLLVLFILVGLACRFIGVMWDSGLHLHPDERFLTMTLPDLKWPHTAADYFQTDKAGLNPFNKKDVNFFVYGQLPLVMVKAVAGAFGRDNYDGILLFGRLLSALFDCGSVLLLFFIGKRSGGKTLGLCAAALLALTALNIQQSHFFTVDTFASFFLVASFYAALVWVDTPRQQFAFVPSVLAGLMLGAALACKISSVFFIVPILFLAAIRGKRGHWLAAFAELVLLFFVAFLFFRIANPMTFRGEATPGSMGGFLDIRFAPSDGERGFWGSIQRQREISAGIGDLPWNIQWIGRTNYIFPLRNLLGWGTGWALGLASIAGMAMVLVGTGQRIFKRQLQAPHPALIAAVLWSVFCFAYYGGQYSKFTRYYLVITPFMALLAAWVLCELKQKPKTRWASCFVPGATACWALAVTSIYTRPHSRIAASDWIRAHIAPNTPIANETSWDDTLPIGTTQLDMLNLELYDTDSLAKRQALLDKLDKAQWIFISSNRTWGSTPRRPQKYPMTTEFYRALFDGRLGFAPVKQFTSYPRLFGFNICDDSFEEGLTVYDHPRVVLYQKTANWSRLMAERILTEQLAAAGSDTPLEEIRDSGWNPERDSKQPLPVLPYISSKE